MRAVFSTIKIKPKQLITVVIFLLIAVIFNLLALRISSRISTDFCADLREEIFVKVQSFSAAEIDKFGTASLTTRSTMENGDIKEVGDHDTLIKLGGKYADLYNSQFG